MADDEQSTSDMVSGLAQVFAGQLRAVTEGLENLAGFGESRLPSDRGPLLLPGALSAAQVTSIAGSVAAQRRSIEALKAQLSAFDEQLAVLEQILGPFAEWSRTWADLEKQLVDMRRKPEAEGSLPSLPIRSSGSHPAVRGKSLAPTSTTCVFAASLRSAELCRTRARSRWKRVRPMRLGGPAAQALDVMANCRPLT